MAEEGKKISFGFSKSIKKTVLSNAPKEVKKVDYIECVDQKSIKIVGGEEKKDEPLVIPMLGSKTWHDRIINHVDADIYETKPKKSEAPQNETKPDAVIVKQEPMDSSSVLNNENVPVPMESIEIKKEIEETTPLTLEEQAAKEIIAETSNKNSEEQIDHKFTVPVTEKDNLVGKAESTLEDYEKIPIEAFGMAMLRGMGWKPDKGIGKNQKVIQPNIPELRPKGMGLGADKMLLQKLKQNAKKKGEEQLKLVKGSFVKILSGKHSDNYGVIEGFDDDVGRLIVKLSLTEEVISVNEIAVLVVTKAEYTENSKVLNLKSYEEYKKNESKSSSKRKSVSDDEGAKLKSHKSRKEDKIKDRKKMKKHRRHSSDSEDSQYEKSRRRDSSSEEENYKHKSKKTKHKKRDSSCERSKKKSKKKDRDYEHSKHRRRDRSDSSERTKHKKSRRSRSYSPRR